MWSWTTTRKRIVAAGLLGVDIVEAYSPERIRKVCVKYGLIPGASIDLTTGWDPCNRDDQAKVRKIVINGKPFIIIGSPPCTLFSTLQELVKHTMQNNPEWQAKFKEAFEKAKEHVRCCLRAREMLFKTLLASDGKFSSLPT